MSRGSGGRDVSTMPHPIITLTTDFGADSPYVAAMKGVILSVNPAATIVDITHAVPPQNVRQGAVALEQAAGRFPTDAVHVAVIDPGVGTGRKIVFARIGRHNYVAPDNGLLSGLAQRTPPSTIVALTNRRYWLPEVSATFHGRDIMAPVAARISMGLEPKLLGPRVEELVPLQWPKVEIVPGKIIGSIRSIDSFGNLVTDITAEMIQEAPTDESLTIWCDGHATHGLFQTYGDQPEMTLIALVGSSGYLELAIVNDRASQMLGVPIGEQVIISW